MKKLLFIVLAFVIAISAIAPLAYAGIAVVPRDKDKSSSSTSDSSTVDLRDKDTSKPVKLLR